MTKENKPAMHAATAQFTMDNRPDRFEVVFFIDLRSECFVVMKRYEGERVALERGLVYPCSPSGLSDAQSKAKHMMCVTS